MFCTTSNGMEYPLYNQKAENIGKVNLPDKVFGLSINKDLLYQVVNSLMANKRQVIAHTKGRSEVRGGGKKPWRQKGTGRARHGSIRSPIWKGGGVTHGPTKERSFKKKINRKMARKALLIALSSKVRDNQVLVVDNIQIEKPKTKEMVIIFKNFSKLIEGQNNNFLLVTPTKDEAIFRASKNIKNVDMAEAKSLNSLLVLANKNLILTKDSVDAITKTFGK